MVVLFVGSFGCSIICEVLLFLCSLFVGCSSVIAIALWWNNRGRCLFSKICFVVLLYIVVSVSVFD